jgi:hypothetical protein
MNKPHFVTASVPELTRRAWLTHTAAASVAVSLPLLGGCSTPLPLTTAAPATASGTPSPGAQRLLDSARAHGWDAYRALADINIGYDGQWRPAIDRIQPEVVDIGFRGASQERLLPALGVNAQMYAGPRGNKHVLWQRGHGTGTNAATLGDIAVHFNGQASAAPGPLTAAAVVAECYALFLLGPLWVLDRLGGRQSAVPLTAQLSGTQRVDNRLCDVVQVWLSPGLGQAPLDRVALYIDRDDHTTRRMAFTLEGYNGTRGAVAETDTFEHQRRFGVLWPMRSFERVVHPLHIAVHDWFITGLDVNRGYGVQALLGPQFTGLAARQATPV